MGRGVEIFLPSSDPDIQLEARLFEPSPGYVKGLALVAHPYGWLGGSFDDPVVQSVVAVFVELGYRTISFNARGVGKSGGKGSWTAQPEAADYQAVYEASLARFVDDHRTIKDARLVVAGYSAGSLHASAVRTPELPSQMSPVIRYLLISYPLDKLWIIAPFNRGKWKQRVEELASQEKTKVLMIQGASDQFTKSDNYDSWAQQLKDLSANNDATERDRHAVEATFVSEMVDADHFWRTEDSLRGLIEGIQRWLV